MAEESITLISLPQMVDLALNSPEVGIVNFTVLHSLLHVIVNQLDLEECNVEFRGSDSERLQNYISTAKPGPIITLTEYTVGPDGKDRKKRPRRGKRPTVDEKLKKDENLKEKEIAILKKEDEENVSIGSESMQPIVVGETASKEKNGDTPKSTNAFSKEIRKLQKDIKELQSQMKELTEVPGNTGLTETTSKDDSSSPIVNKAQILNLVKRLDVTEVAVNKMASIIDDLAKGQNSITEADSNNKSNRGVSLKEETQNQSDQQHLKTKSQDLITKSQELKRSLGNTVGGANQIQNIISGIKNLENRVVQLENRPADDSRVSGSVQKRPNSERGSYAEDSVVKKMKETKIESISEEVNEERGKAITLESDTEGVNLESPDLSALEPKDAIAELQKEILDIKENNWANQAIIEALKIVEQLKESLMSGDNQNLPPDVKLGQLDIKISDLKDQVSTLDTVYNQQFSNINDHTKFLEQEIVALWDRINSGLLAGDLVKGEHSQSVQELYEKLTQLQDDMDGISKIANKLLLEQEGRQDNLDVMIEQIELLKTVKADREDLEDALADKADACQINRKVSYEQFDAAYDEITKSLENTLVKLKDQEEMWIQSLNDLQKEMGNKLDKMELTPLKDFINQKLEGIQNKVKKISALKQEHEAAGAKSKLLRNLNCISCDADVVMKKQTDITLFPKPYAMPANKSPGPYLAYELDLLRKQQKSLNTSKNMNFFESALQTGKLKTSVKDHLCNRYCGGSHTVTTPEQRVMRIGHFMEQWGPEIAPVNDLLIKGTDGHYYKGRDDSALRAAALERGPTPRTDPPALTVSGFNASSSAQNTNQKNVKQESQSTNAITESTTNAATPSNNNNNVNNSIWRVAKAEGRTSDVGSLSKRPKTSVSENSSKTNEIKRSSVRSADPRQP
ncbi:hypothetical protein ABEB36_010132 [Hypothenemus hampei]|uniref:DUF4795 domain-containing protein n=1 Tax=Hypothenemus hampei TaxID=57062 RepID=A0ABD1EJ38_HYPHA